MRTLAIQNTEHEPKNHYKKAVKVTKNGGSLVVSMPSEIVGMCHLKTGFRPEWKKERDELRMHVGITTQGKRKAYRRNGTLYAAIPPLLADSLGITRGDWLESEWHVATHYAKATYAKMTDPPITRMLKRVFKTLDIASKDDVMETEDFIKSHVETLQAKIGSLMENLDAAKKDKERVQKELDGVFSELSEIKIEHARLKNTYEPRGRHGPKMQPKKRPIPRESTERGMGMMVPKPEKPQAAAAKPKLRQHGQTKATGTSEDCTKIPDHVWDRFLEHNVIDVKLGVGTEDMSISDEFGVYFGKNYRRNPLFLMHVLYETCDLPFDEEFQNKHIRHLLEGWRPDKKGIESTKRAMFNYSKYINWILEGRTVEWINDKMHECNEHTDDDDYYDPDRGAGESWTDPVTEW